MQRTLDHRHTPHALQDADAPRFAVLRVDDDGVIRHADAGGEVLLGDVRGVRLETVLQTTPPSPAPPWAGSALLLARDEPTGCRATFTALPGEDGFLVCLDLASPSADTLLSLRHSGLPVALRDADSIFRFVSPAFAALFGIPERSFRNAPPETILPKGIAKALRQADRATLLRMEAHAHTLPSPTGEHTVQCTTIPLPRTAWGTAVLSIALHAEDDASGHPYMDHAFAMGPYDPWQLLLDEMPGLLALTDFDGRVQLLNKAGHALLRLPDGVARGRHRAELLPEGIASKLAADNERMKREGTSAQLEVTLPRYRHDGSDRTFLVQRFPVRDQSGGMCGVGTVAVEISEMKRTEAGLRQRLTNIEAMVASRNEELRIANEALHRSSTRFRALFDYAPDGLLLQRDDGTLLDCNRMAETTLGLSRFELLALKARDICREGCALPVPETEDTPLRTRADLLRDGIPFPAEVSVRSLDIEGERTLLVAFRDISSRVHTEHRLNLFELVFRNALEGILITDASGAILAVNPAFTTITGWNERDAVGRNPRILKSNRHDRGFYERLWHALHERGAWEGEIWNRRINGENYPEWLSISAIRDESGATTNYVALFHDISDLKAKEAQIRYQGMHDALTGLPNRALLLERLDIELKEGQGTGRLCGLLYIDIDNFKTINDSLGHESGDKFIAEVAEHLTLLIRPEDTLSRLGGDEYVILVANPGEEREVVLVAERILHHFSQPLTLLDRELHVGLSIGIAIHPTDGKGPDELLTNADLAMYRAKAQGKNTYERFSPHLHDRIRRRMELEGRLRHALRHGEIVPHFQPRVDLVSGRIVGAEALARWTLPDGTRVSPGEFIPVAEDLGLIFDLGEHMLRSSLAFTRKLIDEGLPDLTMAVNLSLVQCRHSDLVGRVLAALRDTGVAPERLELEITESAIMTDVTRTLRRLDRLAALGITLAVDDFGTGYSSLYHLKHMPLHTLKIDQSFVRDLPHVAGSRTIALTMLAMARNLDLDVIAEGVETGAQMHFLRDHGCRVVQGFLFSPAVPGDRLLDMLRRGVCFDVNVAPGEISFDHP